jgi:uncharacterized protein YfaS (alpha-2-macroglobulin family)
MQPAKRSRVRKSLSIIILLASCVHTPPSNLPVTERLKLSELGSGPRGKAPFAVVAAGPRGTIAQDNDPGISMVFNRAMRLVGAPADEGVPPVRIENDAGKVVEGYFRWVGTRGLLFKPKDNLAGATRYTVTVPAGTRAKDGAVLSSPYRYEFATPRPALKSAFPERPLRTNETLFLQFSQPVAPSELQTKLGVWLKVPGQQQRSFVAATVRRGAPDWLHRDNTNTSNVAALYSEIQTANEPTGTWLEVIPKEPLRRDREYELVIGKGLRSTEGSLGTENEFTVPFRSYGPLRLSNLECARKSLGRCQAHRDFTALFTNPVRPEEFRRFLKIVGPHRPTKPNTGAKPSIEKVALAQPLKLDPEFGDEFRITFRAGMTDVFGQKLEKDVSVVLSIEEPYTKALSNSTKYVRGVSTETGQDDESEASASQAGHAPRRLMLRYDLELGVTGHILEAKSGVFGQAKGFLPSIPISSINVPTYGLHTERLPEWSTIQWLNGVRPSALTTSFDWITPNAPTNSRAVREISLSTILEGAQTGTAVVSLIGLGQINSDDRIVNVTDLGLSAKVSRFGSLVWVTQLSTGTQVKNATVSVYNRAGDIVATKLTDEQGLVSFSAQELVAIDKYGRIDSSLLLVARANDDFTYQRLEVARAKSGMGDVDYEQRANWLGLVFTDRSVYRPGESIQAGGFFRMTAEKGLTIEPGRDYQYQIIDSQSETVAVGEGKLDNYGALSQQIRLSRTAAYGTAQLFVKLGRRNEEQFTSDFEILAYKPAEFKVTVEPDEHDYVHRGRAKFRTNAEYLYGSPIAEGRVSEYVSRQEINFEPPNSKDYVTNDGAYLSDLRFSTNRGSAYSHESKLLDKAGQLRSEVLLDAPEQSKPESLTVEVEVQDLSGQTQSGRASVIVHPANHYVGLKQLKKRFLAVGANVPIDARAFSPRGEILGNVPISVELFRRNWMSALEDNPTDILHHRTYVRDEGLGKCDLVTSRNAAVGSDCRLRVDSEGYYVIRASSNDSSGNVIHSSLGVFAVSDRADSGASRVAWQREDRRGLSLELDQSRYLPGDVAKVLIKSPFREGTALVTVERGGIFERRVVVLRGQMPVIDLPVKDEYYPNAFVSVHLIRGRIAKAPLPGNADVGAPEYKVGYAKLIVDPESHRLKVNVVANQKEFQPGDEVTSRVSLRKPDGNPTAGTVTFYVVDEGVLRLTGYKTPDPLPAFAAHRNLGVFPVESRDNLARILAYRQGELISPLGFEYENNTNDKGEEIGGGGIPGRIRSDFRTTVYFKAGVPVGNDGDATFRFKLPDNLTSYRLMVVAAGNEERFGFGEGTITANKKLMARPSLPRILRVGDELDASVVVSSKENGPMSAKVGFKAKGLKVQGPSEKMIPLVKNEQSLVRFPVKVEKAGDVNFDFSVSSGSVSDRVSMSRVAEQPIRWLSASVYGTTDKSVRVGLDSLASYRKDQGEVSISLSNSPLVGLKSVFDELAEYPYGCTEQLTSRVLPLLLAQKLAETQNVRVRASQGDSIDVILGELSKRQQSSGGLGFWEGDETQNPWLTAYGLLALETGSHAGYFVPKRIRDNIAEFLVRYLDGQLSRRTYSENDETQGDSEGSDETRTRVRGVTEEYLSPTERKMRDLAETCFVADILSRIGQLDESRLRRLILSRREMSLSSRIHVLYAMAKLRFSRQELDAWLKEIEKEITVGPAEARVENDEPVLAALLASPTRSTAVLLEAVLAINKASPLALKLARGLLEMKKRSGYRNTQENAWVLLALEEYRNSDESTASNFNVDVLYDDKAIGAFDFTASAPKSETVKVSASELVNRPDASVTLNLSNPGRLSYAMQVTLAKDGVSEAPLDEGLSVEKYMRPVSPDQLEEAAKRIPERSENLARLGQLVMVDILIESSEARDRLVIDDPLPSGFEPVDFSLKTTAQSLSVAENTRASVVSVDVPESSSYGRVQSLRDLHREMKDDRVTYFISHISPGIYHLRYLARAAVIGKFVVPPTRVACMYDADVFGQTKATRFEVMQGK